MNRTALVIGITGDSEATGSNAVSRWPTRPGARPIRRFAWVAVYLLAPFVETLREMIEMRYLWELPLRLDNRKLVALLGEEPHTPLDRALRATLAGLGCTRDASGTRSSHSASSPASA